MNSMPSLKGLQSRNLLLISRVDLSKTNRHGLRPESSTGRLTLTGSSLVQQDPVQVCSFPRFRLTHLDRPQSHILLCWQRSRPVAALKGLKGRAEKVCWQTF